MKPLKKKVPFSLELKRETFENIEKLIAYSQKVKAETIQEDLLSSCLFLLKMQVFILYLDVYNEKKNILFKKFCLKDNGTCRNLDRVT